MPPCGPEISRNNFKNSFFRRRRFLLIFWGAGNPAPLTGEWDPRNLISHKKGAPKPPLASQISPIFLSGVAESGQQLIWGNGPPPPPFFFERPISLDFVSGHLLIFLSQKPPEFGGFLTSRKFVSFLRCIDFC